MTRTAPVGPIMRRPSAHAAQRDSLRLRTTADPHRYPVNLHLDDAGDAVRPACPLAIPAPSYRQRRRFGRCEFHDRRHFLVAGCFKRLPRLSAPTEQLLR
jgi:hypothetical protein